MLKRCDDSYEAEFSQLLPKHLRSCVLHFGVNICPDVVNLWDTNLPGKISLNVFVIFGRTCQLEHVITEKKKRFMQATVLLHTALTTTIVQLIIFLYLFPFARCGLLGHVVPFGVSYREYRGKPAACFSAVAENNSQTCLYLYISEPRLMIGVEFLRRFCQCFVEPFKRLDSVCSMFTLLFRKEALN